MLAGGKGIFTNGGGGVQWGHKLFDVIHEQPLTKKSSIHWIDKTAIKLFKNTYI